MIKVKRWAFDFLTSQTHEDRVIRFNSIKVGIGVFIVVFSLFVMSAAKKMPKTYDDISSSTKTEIMILNQAAKDKQPITLVLRRTGCPACNRAESTIVKNVYWYRLTRPTNKIVILDLKQMNSKQVNQLVADVPDAKTKRGIPTPLVANLNRSGSHWHAKQISASDDKQAIKNVFSQSGF